MKSHKFCIIGSGITGITIAKELKPSLIVEKSKGIGGRFAARRLGGLSVEHGVQEFLHPNLAKTISKPHEWIKSESSDLEILRSWEVKSFMVSNENIVLHSTEDEKIVCTNLIITAPAFQAKKLIEKSSLDGSFLNSVRYRSDIQLMIYGKKQFDINNPLRKYFEVSSLTQTPDDSQIIFLTMKNEFVENFIDMDKDEIKKHFISDADETIVETHVHKWRYSEVSSSISSSYQLQLQKKNVFLAGDYFGTNGVQSALESANFLLSKLKS